MNIQDYIQSGIIEMVVLGLAGHKEREEFEELCARYPELIASRQEFEAKLEELHKKASGIMPPEEVKKALMEAIKSPSDNQAQPGNKTSE